MRPHLLPSTNDLPLWEELPVLEELEEELDEVLFEEDLQDWLAFKIYNENPQS